MRKDIKFFVVTHDNGDNALTDIGRLTACLVILLIVCLTLIAMTAIIWS